ncbi:MAG: 2-C-methyl-D-erythritol 4-phosphate cytidylyltransferase [Lachnospiraceae bacterium]
MKITAIILAAGSGKRMQSAVPKQYLDLKGKPVLYYSLQAFEASAVDEIILVTAKKDLSYCKKEIIERYGFKKVKKIVAGGAERYDSVFSGLQAAEQPDYVLIHDGARPLLTQKIIKDSIQAVQKYKACVVGMPVKDTIKEVNEQEEAIRTPEREFLWQVQTPQSFSYSLIYAAYEKVLSSGTIGVTDDAMVVEKAFQKKVHLIKGSYENIKITTPEDLKIAEIFINP